MRRAFTSLLTAIISDLLKYTLDHLLCQDVLDKCFPILLRIFLGRNNNSPAFFIRPPATPPTFADGNRIGVDIGLVSEIAALEAPNGHSRVVGQRFGVRYPDLASAGCQLIFRRPATAR